MNLNNIRKVQLHGARVLQTGDHIAVSTATQRALGFGRPPSLEESDQFTEATRRESDPGMREFVDDPAALPAVRSILALTKFDHQTHQAMNDTRLSHAGRAEALQEPRKAVIQTIGKAAADIAAHGAMLAQSEQDFYKPAKLPAGDGQAAHEDVEQRNYFRASPIAKRTQMLEQMQTGKNDRMLEALVRGPIALEGHEGTLVQTAWHAAVDKRAPKQAAELKSSRANVDWAQSVTRAAAQYATRSTGLTPLEIAAAAKDTGGECLFSTDTSDTAVNAA